ncbi:alpha/beta hydrolase family protein [Streptomyces himalayensis]|uniref:Alpha/beta hydrolase n=1 Tax=Streptomyces himalayensis subsp. himalayensis TaxID=2756131 RepID=A0A7W0DW90_9ACTN|nr:alpha/beta hydrolase [Streptomyces himalayensis]MBA2951913.1 alpha/beta hydrolase [Streptomyces himalayensis subsp. himalayensis]
MTISGRERPQLQPHIRVLHDASRRDLREPDRPRPVRLYLWEPCRPVAVPAPLVVVSHGTGGSGSDMEWLVGPLAKAGFRVAVVDHHGNNFVDGYDPDGFCFVWERPKDISFALDALAREQPLGPVGAAGFSLGGYTVMALAGARLDPQVLQAVVAGRVALPVVPEFPGLSEALRKKVSEASEDELRTVMSVAAADLSDPRVRAVFQVAPSLGASVTPESLTAVRVPVEIRWGGADTIVPFDDHTKPYLEHIPAAQGCSVGLDIRHEDFIGRSDPAGPADETVRVRVGQEASAFFLRHLG